MSCDIHLRAISSEMFKIFMLDIRLKITDLRLQPHHPREWVSPHSNCPTGLGQACGDSVSHTLASVSCNIAQVYRLSAVQSQMTSYSQRVAQYSMSANGISFDKKISQSDSVFQLMSDMEEHYSPSPLCDFNRLFEVQIGVLFKSRHVDMIYFLNGINLAPKM